jgi:putative ABC transport system permease protein
MIPLATSLLRRSPARFLITAGGVAVVTMLMLFLSGVFEGVRRNALGYVNDAGADAWICGPGAGNLLRSSSFLPDTLVRATRRMPGVEAAAGLLRVIVSSRADGRDVSFVVFGFDPDAGLGRPRTIVAGRGIPREGEIVLDRVFARKYGYTVGGALRINGRRFAVCGISDRTNAVESQFCFMRERDARSVLGVGGVTGFVLVRFANASAGDSCIAALRRRFPETAVYDRAAFLANNEEELRKGVLPILGTIAVFGALAGIAIITLLLYGSVLERREEYAVLKAIGAPTRTLFLLVLRQSLLGSGAGFAAGTACSFAAGSLIERIVPEVSLAVTGTAVAVIGMAAAAMGSLGALLPARAVARIYPAEVFRA